jgi:hypothetical protein
MTDPGGLFVLILAQSKEHTKGTKIGTSDSFLNFVRVVVTTQ